MDIGKSYWCTDVQNKGDKNHFIHLKKRKKKYVDYCVCNRPKSALITLHFLLQTNFNTIGCILFSFFFFRIEQILVGLRHFIFKCWKKTCKTKLIMREFKRQMIWKDNEREKEMILNYFFAPHKWKLYLHVHV